MRFDTGQHLRIDQRMKLAPRMIQSMEILQMATAALEERLEQELSTNPTLELREPGADKREIESERVQEERDAREGERPLVVGDAAPKSEDAGPDRAGTQADDFERLNNIAEEYGDSWDSNTADDYRPSRIRGDDGERDKKLDAIANTASRPHSLADQLLDQWRYAEVDGATRKAGEYLIGFIDDDGYIRTEWATILQQAPPGVAVEQLDAGLAALQQSLEPVGLAARDLRECLLLQIDARMRDRLAGRHVDDDEEDRRPVDTSDLALERKLVADHLKDIEVNRLPKISEQTGASLDQIKKAILNLRQFHPHPGRLLIDDSPRSITPDAVIEYDEEQDRYVATLTKGRLPSVHINPRYVKMARDKAVDRKTRDFVGNNLRSARWLLDAIEQRQHTLLRVINVVIDAQRDFFDQGPQALKPLPMTQVADQLGIHVATVSRAVNEKYLQTPRGIFPLRMFFSGGTETQQGEAMSWTAVQAKLQEVIDAEDKSNPLSDDELVEKLQAGGIEIARRTVAKYRKQLKIPTARQRRQF